MGSKHIDPHEVTSAEPIRPGKLASGYPIGGYRLEQVLGEGGMGVVWAAHDPNLDRRLAIKVLKRTDAVPALRKRLLREARAMARLKHPNVLTVYEVGTEGDRDFIAMELVEGGTLDEWLATQPSREEAMKAVLAAGRGLAAAHAAGLVHRDFKPHNVLRSKEGRVVVTDFGLARGLGEESGSGTSQAPAQAALGVTASPSARSTDSVLDSPLTQTGAMIGTPAYMAPEQFCGAAPDPRTDQFAFCVTAWQALTGARPYTGTSIDELRIAAAAGVAQSLKVDLAPDVRAALARGLDPDPAKRWPTLDELLEALDVAVRPRRPRWIVPAVLLALIGLFAVTVLIARRGGALRAAVAAGCAPGEDAFAEAWSPQLRSELATAIAARGIELTEAGFARLAGPLDAYREHWTQAFATACKAPEKVGAKQRDCLLAARDQTSAVALVLREGPAPMFATIDLHGLLPDLAGCAGNNPNAPPHPPQDPQLRTKVVQLLAKAFALGASPQFLTSYPALEEEARTIGWPALLPLVEIGFGFELLRRGEHVRARVEMQKVIDAPAESREPRTLAHARFGLLEASLTELTEPESTAKPGELHHEIARLLRYVRADVRAAGGDPTLAAALARYEARAQLGLAQRGRYPKAFDEALAQARKASELYRSVGDPERAARVAALTAEILVLRGGPTALDDAMFEARGAAETLVAMKLDPVGRLDRMRATIEYQRGEYAIAQQLFARVASSRPAPGGPTRTGRVVAAGGAPVANARVVAWRGELAGDPMNVVTDPAELDGEVVETAADGTFTIHAAPGDAIVAELAKLRSAPTLVTPAPLELELEPTHDRLGSVDRPLLIGVSAEARYVIGKHAWSLRAPIAKDRTFHLRGMPRGTPVFGAIGPASDGERRVTAGSGIKLTWPIGEAIEVIARGPLGADATAWVFRGKQSPTLRTDAESLAGRSGEVAWGLPGPIGADNTDAGRAVYRAGDHHVVISGNLDGEVSVCLARSAALDAVMSCQSVTIKQTIVVPAGEGPRGVGVTPVVLAEDTRGINAP